MAEADYRAHKLIFSRFSEPRFRKAYRAIAGQCPIPLAPQVGQQLRKGLFEAQRNLLILAIEADLALFRRRDSNILFIELSGKQEQALQAALADPAKLKEFETDGQPTRSGEQAYAYYCKVVLGEGFRPGHALSPSTRYLYFLQRNPMAELLLEISLENFIGNIKDSLSKVVDDRKALETCFLQGKKIEEIAGIVCTGSDSQRGGRQVLFLDLASEGGNVKRIVYKPSDLEADYRIVGANTPELKRLLEQHKGDPGYPDAHPSICELLNEQVLKDVNRQVADDLGKDDDDRQRLEKQLLLPTYLVLPRNPGSKLPGTNPDIRKSYGYLEFLAHEPKPTTKPQHVNDSGAIVSYLKRGWWRAHPNPDWITREWSDVAVCMRTWGRLGAIAYVLLLSDLHYENRRLRFRRPHLIDLEMGFLGTMDLLSRTALFQKLDRAVQDSAGKIEVRIADGPSGPISRAGSQLGSTLHYGSDQLYLADVETTRHPLFRDPDLAPQVVRGIKDVFEHLTHEKLTAWADQINLSQLIVRFAYPENFSGTMIEAAGSIVRKRPADAKKDRKAAARRELANFWAGFLEGRRKFNLSNDAVSGWLDGWPRTGNPGRRFYALETPTYLGADFLNLDLPRFYRRIGSRELLTSRGDPVRFQPEFFRLDELFAEHERKKLKYIFDSKTQAEAALQFDQFFVTTGLDDFTGSMQEKLLPDAKSRRALLAKQIRGVQLGKKDPYQAGILPDMDVKTLFKL